MISFSESAITQVDKVLGLKSFDAVKASIEVSGVLWQGRNLVQFSIITVNTATYTHTQQTGGHACGGNKVSSAVDKLEGFSRRHCVTVAPHFICEYIITPITLPCHSPHIRLLLFPENKLQMCP